MLVVSNGGGGGGECVEDGSAGAADTADAVPTAEMPQEAPADRRLHANDVADGLLLAAAAPSVTAVRIERRPRRFEIAILRGAEPEVLGYTSWSLGEAVLARLAIVARVRRQIGHETLGRCRIRIEKGTAEMLLSIREASCEIRHLSGVLGPPLFMLEPSAASERIGSYVLETVLGRGGMGTVYRAVHEWLGTRAAVKVLHRGAGHGLDATRAALFVREAWAASRVKHPGVVRVIDAGVTPDRAYLVMELIEAPTLRQLLQRGPMGVAEAAAMGSALCRAVEAIHELGIVHCDLKPENVFVCTDGDVKITDFGAAWTLDASRARGEWPLFATPEYLAPEVATGQTPVPASDIYSIGCVIQEALTGELAPHDPRVPRARVDGAPPRLAEIVDRALAVRPEDRFASAGEMAHALETWSSSSTTVPEGRTRVV